MAFTVGLFSNLPDGEYSSRSKVGLSTSMRASPDRTMADWWAMPSDMSTGVARFTGDASLRDAPVAPDAAARGGSTTTVTMSDVRTSAASLPVVARMWGARQANGAVTTQHATNGRRMESADLVAFSAWAAEVTEPWATLTRGDGPDPSAYVAGRPNECSCCRDDPPGTSRVGQASGGTS